MGKRTREPLAMDITPLIDVVFLLLIFFMVSTVFKKNELALLLTLPNSSKLQTTSKSNNKVSIEVTKNEIAFNGEKIKISNLDPFLKAVTNKSIPVELRIDKNVDYGRVIDVLDRLKFFKLSNLALITDQ